LVGGTGLYIDAVLFGFGFLSDADLDNRAKLEALSVSQLQKIIENKGYIIPVNSQNKRHLVRVIETEGKIGTKNLRPMTGTVVIGIMPPDDDLKNRIDMRAEQLFTDGVVKETKKLVQEYGKKVLERSGGIVYKICLKLNNGTISLGEAKELDKIADWQYARRQRTWFRRNPYIKWFSDTEQACGFIADQLNT
jgi:tRNA dimethylallyltransferase